jgi:AraC family transcriptional regulator, regulatory protein of adaptative response / methylated-DNA-[protein]-cysteine methyltransferase
MSILTDNDTAPIQSDAARWEAVLARDVSADGQFYYSVRTSGVYCRPSCKARPALRKNVGFHASCADAERAGFRACKRCKPNGTATVTPDPADTAIGYAVGACSLGAVMVAASRNGICAILLGDDATALLDDLRGRFPRVSISAGDNDLQRLLAQVVDFIEAPARGFELPLDIKGTSFQRRVWQALRGIPAGATASYADVAARIGSPKAVRAVAHACAVNSIAVAIPCHRVVRSDGALSGYRWGVTRKRTLLTREKAI